MSISQNLEEVLRSFVVTMDLDDFPRGCTIVCNCKDRKARDIILKDTHAILDDHIGGSERLLSQICALILPFKEDEELIELTARIALSVPDWNMHLINEFWYSLYQMQGADRFNFHIRMRCFLLCSMLMLRTCEGREYHVLPLRVAAEEVEKLHKSPDFPHENFEMSQLEHRCDREIRQLVYRSARR